MAMDDFSAEFRRMLRKNVGAHVNDDKVLALMSDDIRTGADFINVTAGVGTHNKMLYLVTTRTLYSVKVGTFSTKVEWSVPVADVREASPRRSHFQGHESNELVLETKTGVERKFRFGFNNSSFPPDRPLIETARHNLEVALHETELAMRTADGEHRESSAPSGTHAQAVAGLRRFAQSIALATGQSSIGRPLGEGAGLEELMALLPQSFESIEILKCAGRLLAVQILSSSDESGGIGPEDFHRVMGTDDLASSGLNADQQAAVQSLAGAAESFLGQFEEEDSSLWELWKRRDDVAGEFLCWHAVAWQRLAALGRVTAIQNLS